MLAIFLFGPFGLVPLWFRPRTNIFIKVLVSAVVIAMTVWTTMTMIDIYYRILEEYKELGLIP